LLAGTLAGLLILAALLLGTLRLGLSQLPDAAPRIQGWIERQTGLRLEFETIDARMRWWGPEVVLRRVRVLDRDAAQSLFATREATVALDAWSLFRSGELVAGRLRFLHPEVTVVRLPDGRIRLLGQRERPSDRPLFDLERLPAGRLDIEDAVVHFEDRLGGGGPWRLDDVDLSLRRGRGAVDVEGRARLPESLGSQLEFRGRLRGPLDRLADLDARLELSLDRLQLAGVAEFLPAGVGRPTSGTGRLAATLNSGPDGLRQLRAEFDLREVAIALPARELPPLETVQLSAPYRPAGASPLSMPAADKSFVQRPAPPLPGEVRYAALQGRLRLQREGAQWSLRADDLRLERTGAVPAAPARVSGRWSGHPRSAFALRLDAASLRAADLWPLALAFAPHGLDAWAGLDPQGEIRSLGADALRERAGSPLRFAVSAEVEALGTRPVGRWPGLTGLSARVSGTEERGRIALDARAPSFEWPRLFRSPLVPEHVQAQVDWRRDGADWVLASDDVDLRHAAGEARGRFELRLGAGPGGPLLVAEAEVPRLDIAALPQFLPVGRMQPRTVAWFEGAFLGGRASEGRLSYRGPVRRFPFRGGEGEFVAGARFEDVELRYYDGFPNLTGAAGRADFRNAATVAVLERGEVAGLAVGPARYSVDDYREPLVLLDATASGDLGRALTLLQRSPLGPSLGEQFMALGGEGAADYRLRLELPSQDPDARRYTVTTRLRSATVRWPVLRAPVSRLSGELEIGERAVRTRSLRGTFLDGPFELTARPATPGEGMAMSVLLAGEGRAAGAPLPPVIGLPAGIRMSGSLPWRLEGRIDRPAGSRRPWPVRLEFDSSLAGLVIDAPRPFAKGAAETRATRVVLDLPRPGRSELEVDSGAARAALVFARQGEGRWVLERGVARFDGRPLERPTRTGLHVAGDWPEFDLAEWLALRSGAPGGPRLSDWLGPVDVHLDRARVLGFEILDVTARMQPAERAWRIELAGPMAEGVVLVPEDLAPDAPIDLAMQRLYLREPEGSGSASRAPDPDPRELPGLRVRAEDFTWQGRRFGRLEATVRREPAGLRLERLETRAPEFTLRGTGTWLVEPDGPRTRLGLALDSTDLAATSRALGYREAVDAKRARVTAELQWPGGPDRDSIARMDGTLRLELDEGQLRGVKPGAGRILGLVSVVELPRRLALDFRDVTDEGLAFDTVRGDFEVRGGNAHTRNLLLKGAAVDVGVVGRTGLAAQDYDQTVVVSGNPSGPITIAGALAGGPVGAAGALLVSQLFKGQLQGLARIYYRVTGSWSDPVVERISASAASAAAEEPPP
jgi:uncharacterized protein (TIGR02099 family)